METNKRLMNLLGIARRAGRLELGSAAAKDAVRKRRAKLLLLSSDLSERTTEGMRGEAERAGVRAVALSAGMDEVEFALGRRTGIIAVSDEGFAKALLKLSAENEED